MGWDHCDCALDAGNYLDTGRKNWTKIRSKEAWKAICESQSLAQCILKTIKESKGFLGWSNYPITNWQERIAARVAAVTQTKLAQASGCSGSKHMPTISGRYPFGSLWLFNLAMEDGIRWPCFTSNHLQMDYLTMALLYYWKPTQLGIGPRKLCIAVNEVHGRWSL